MGEGRWAYFLKLFARLEGEGSKFVIIEAFRYADILQAIEFVRIVLFFLYVARILDLYFCVLKYFLAKLLRIGKLPYLRKLHKVGHCDIGTCQHLSHLIALLHRRRVILGQKRISLFGGNTRLFEELYKSGCFGLFFFQ